MRRIIGIITFVLVISFIFFACDNSDTTLNPTYESITIHPSIIKVNTVTGDDGLITFYGSGAQFNAKVNGSNNPVQNVYWEILEDTDTETNINNGILSVGVTDHGKTLTIKVTSAIDTNVTSTLTIMVVKCLFSDFFGNWKVTSMDFYLDSNVNRFLWHDGNSKIFEDWTIIKVSTLFNEYLTYKTDYPCGYKIYRWINEIPMQDYEEFFFNIDGLSFYYGGLIFTLIE